VLIHVGFALSKGERSGTRTEQLRMRLPRVGEDELAIEEVRRYSFAARRR